MSRQERIDCPLGTLTGLLSGPWTIYLIWVLRHQSPIRFGALQREISGISTKILTERLRMLEAEGIVYREYKPTIPPEVTYGLTTRGQELIEIIDRLNELAKRWYENTQTESSAQPLEESRLV
jgi:DNA-binding HxlR family transcriptional regulator